MAKKMFPKGPPKPELPIEDDPSFDCMYFPGCGKCFVCTTNDVEWLRWMAKTVQQTSMNFAHELVNLEKGA